jgi:F420-dependent oxidoreductase-like protein
MPNLSFGILLWNQATDWPSYLEAARKVDRLGYTHLWAWDHLYAIFGDPYQPIYEGWASLSAAAVATEHTRLGLLVGANTFRNPGLVAKLATTLDHISDGRAILGIGGAWFEREHDAYGIAFGSGFGERLDRLDEAVGLLRRLLDGERIAHHEGRYYRMHDALVSPGPIQEHLPILIGGGGEKKTLRTVARFADAWNIGTTVERARHKDEVLRRWCEEVGRDHREIERTLSADAIVIRDSESEARRVAREMGRLNGGDSGPDLVGPPALIAEHLAPFLELGFRHIYIDLPAPYDRETLERFIGEVKPLLAEADTGATVAGVG